MADANSTSAATRSNFPREHSSWKSMWARCTRPTNASWKYYGARGVTVCDRWKDFAAFMHDMGPKPTKRHQIGRIDNRRGYGPGNCRWETPRQQQANTSKCHWLTHAGKTLHLADWARRTGLSVSTISYRVAGGATAAEALRPAESSNKRYSITFNGITQSLSAWAASVGISLGSLRDRLTRGWDLARALTTPPRKQRSCFFLHNSGAKPCESGLAASRLDQASDERKLLPFKDDSTDLGPIAPVAQLDRAMVFGDTDEAKRDEGEK